MKDGVKRMRRLVFNWENIFAKDTSDKGLLSKIQKILNKKKTNNLIKKGAKDPNWCFREKDILIASKHMNRCSASYAIMES